jgi:hypothetical protein
VIRKLVDEPVVVKRLVDVVVASVVVPRIFKVPFARRFPCGFAKKLRFSAHAEPFQ